MRFQAYQIPKPARIGKLIICRAFHSFPSSSLGIPYKSQASESLIKKATQKINFEWLVLF